MPEQSYCRKYDVVSCRYVMPQTKDKHIEGRIENIRRTILYHMHGDGVHGRLDKRRAHSGIKHSFIVFTVS